MAQPPLLENGGEWTRLATKPSPPRRFRSTRVSYSRRDFRWTSLLALVHDTQEGIFVLTPLKKKTGMTAADFKRIALSLQGAEEGSHMGSVDFRVGGRI